MVASEKIELGHPSAVTKKGYPNRVARDLTYAIGNKHPNIGYYATDSSSELGLNQYLRIIGEGSLLSAEEEIKLAQTMEKGKEAEEILPLYSFSFPELRPQIDTQLNDTLNAANLARNRFIETNLRLVVSIASEYWKQHPGLPLDDYIQEGNIGLLTAVDKYEWRRGNRFSTHAFWWIWQSISRARSNQTRNIRLPVHIEEFLGRVVKAQKVLLQELEREPSPEELAKYCGVSEEDISTALSVAQKPISLDLPIGEDEDGYLGDIVEDRHKNTAEEAAGNISRQEAKQKVETLMKGLTEREQQVITLRRGLDGGKERTLQEIADELRLTRERVRQIEKKAMEKLALKGREKYPENFEDSPKNSP